MHLTYLPKSKRDVDSRILTWGLNTKNNTLGTAELIACKRVIERRERQGKRTSVVKYRDRPRSTQVILKLHAQKERYSKTFLLREASEPPTPPSLEFMSPGPRTDCNSRCNAREKQRHILTSFLSRGTVPYSPTTSPEDLHDQKTLKAIWDWCNVFWAQKQRHTTIPFLCPITDLLEDCSLALINVRLFNNLADWDIIHSLGNNIAGKFEHLSPISFALLIRPIANIQILGSPLEEGDTLSLAEVILGILSTVALNSLRAEHPIALLFGGALKKEMSSQLAERLLRVVCQFVLDYTDNSSFLASKFGQPENTITRPPNILRISAFKGPNSGTYEYFVALCGERVECGTIFFRRRRAREGGIDFFIAF